MRDHGLGGLVWMFKFLIALCCVFIPLGYVEID